MGILTSTASDGLVGKTSAVNPSDLADTFSEAASCLNDDEPPSTGLKLRFFSNLLALAL